MYCRLGDMIVFVSLLAVFFTLYFYQLLDRTRAQAFHGFLAVFSAFCMVCVPWAIHNGARGVSTPPSAVLFFTGIVVGAALLLWPRLSRIQPTANAH